MKDNTEYQIFIGCHDSQLHDEIISEHELTTLGVKLKEMINTDTILITKTEIEYAFV